MPLRCGEEPVRARGEWMCGQQSWVNRAARGADPRWSGLAAAWNSGRVGRGARQSCAQSQHHHPPVASPRDPSSVSLGLSPHQCSGDNHTPYPTGMTVGEPSQQNTGSVAAPPSGVITAGLSVVPGHLSRLTAGDRRPSFRPKGGSASFPWVSGPSPGPKELAHPGPPTRKLGRPFVPLPGCKAWP